MNERLVPELMAGLPDLQVQRYRDYARQRQMTVGDLLLDNRIVFFGSVGSTFYEPTQSGYERDIAARLAYWRKKNEPK